MQYKAWTTKSFNVDVIQLNNSDTYSLFDDTIAHMTPEKTWSRSYYSSKIFRLAAWLRYLSIPVYLLILSYCYETTKIPLKKKKTHTWGRFVNSQDKKKKAKFFSGKMKRINEDRRIRMNVCYFSFSFSRQHQLCKCSRVDLLKSICDPGRTRQRTVAVPRWVDGGGKKRNITLMLLHFKWQISIII